MTNGTVGAIVATSLSAMLRPRLNRCRVKLLSPLAQACRDKPDSSNTNMKQIKLTGIKIKAKCNDWKLFTRRFLVVGAIRKGSHKLIDLSIVNSNLKLTIQLHPKLTK